MIQVTRLNGQKLYINADLIRTIEPTPDTIITLTDDRKLLVKESPEELVRRFIAYRREIMQPLSRQVGNQPDVAV